MSSSISTLALTGFVLGWSVAWPPGPINAEAIRRGLSGRMRAAYLVVLGGCAGDAIWALLVGLGTSTLLMRVAAAQHVVGSVSVVLLLLLAALFFRGGWRSYAELRAGGGTARRASAFDGSGRGFLLGLSLALTGPWNVAFWLAVMGQTGDTGSAGALVTALGVLVGAATWGLVLCGGVALLGVRFARPSWEVFTQFATGALMVAFAVRTAVRLLGA